MELRRITSIEELIEARGGLRAVADIFETTPQNVWNWKNAGRFPRHSYLDQLHVLEKHGFTASPDLWGFTVPRSDTRAEA